MTCAASEDSDQPGDQSDQSLCCAHEEALALGYPLSAQCRLSRCPGWSESLLSAHVILLVFSCCGSIWAATWQNQQSDCAPSKDSDQPGHPPSLIRVFAVRMKKAQVLSYPLSAQQRLWSDWVDAQADLCLRWVHSHIVGFVMSWLIYFCMAMWENFSYWLNVLVNNWCGQFYFERSLWPLYLNLHSQKFKCLERGLMLNKFSFSGTVMILSFRTDMPGQTVQTQIRLLLEEQSDQGLHCLPFRLHRLDSLLYGTAT